MGYAYRIYDQQGVYFITCTVVQWVDVFTRNEYADIIVDSLKYCRKNKGLEIFAWVIMSNHIHLIISCTGRNKLSDILRDFKKYTATQVVQAIENNQQESRKSWLLWLLKQDDKITFWQKDNHAEEITTSNFFKVKRDYIHRNPVAANIVEKEEEYIYSSARTIYGGKGLIELTDYN
ncbi:MAG: transposase [Chitinophagaceae bacterium]|nr:transposase [Chitinophagaceae bacterium]MCB9044579.1 transposase [Chitinophagales bacterium]